MSRKTILLVCIGVLVVLVASFTLWARGVCESSEWATVAGSPNASCWEFWLNRYQTLVAAVSTVIAGYLAYRGAMIPGERAEVEAREAKRQNLDRELRRSNREIDALKSADRYLDTYLQHFEAAGSENEQLYDAFQMTRTLAADFQSTSANSAPAGFGERISTLMSRIDRLGVRIEEFKESTSADTSRSFFAEEVADAVEDLRRLHGQLRETIPEFEKESLGLRSQLDALGGPIDYRL